MGSNPQSKSVKIPKPPHGKPLKEAPPEYRILLHLVALHAQRKNRAVVKDIADYCDIFPSQVVVAIGLILSQGYMELTKAHSPVDFEFALAPEITKGLAREASSYRKHREARLKRKQNAIANEGLRAKWRLPPITAEQRAPFTALGAAYAAKLGITAEDMVIKITNCVARLGPEEIEALVNNTIATQSDKSLCRVFFKLYTERRKAIMTAV